MLGCETRQHGGCPTRLQQGYCGGADGVRAHRYGGVVAESLTADESFGNLTPTYKAKI